MRRNHTPKNQFLPCHAHDSLGAADQSACLRQIPAGVQAQLTFLLDRRAAEWAKFYPKAGPRRIRRLAIKDVARMLNSRPRTVRCHAKGSRMRPDRALRDRLNSEMIRAFCPVHLAEVDAENAALAARTARRHAARNVENREQARVRQAALQARLGQLPPG